MTRISGTVEPVRRRTAGFALPIGMVMIFMASSGVGLAEKLVDPNTVAPEYRAVAEKRRAEQLKLFECSKKADAAKIVRRDRAAFVTECVDK